MRSHRLFIRFTNRYPLFQPKSCKKGLYKASVRRVIVRAGSKAKTPARKKTFVDFATELSYRPVRIQLPAVASNQLTEMELETIRRETG